jgi:hypothetical protein
VPDDQCACLQARLEACAKAQARFEEGFGAGRATELRTLLRAVIAPVLADGSSYDPVKRLYAPEGRARQTKCNTRAPGFIMTH